MADLRLTRDEALFDGITGTLSLTDGTPIARTLEHAYPGGIDGFESKVLTGNYLCRRGTHQLEHGPAFETFEVIGVPGHTGILFHKGNTQKDSQGCILLGEYFLENSNETFLMQSFAAFEAFMKLQEDCNEFTLTVV